MSLKSAGSFRRFVHDGSMKAIMKLEELTTVEHLSHFLQGTQAVAFSVSSDKDKRYRWLQKELVRFDYLSLNKPEKALSSAICSR